MNRRLKRYKKGDAFYGKVPKEQAKKMALLWGEGSKNLTNLIEYCILNDIGTFASCKGHSEWAQGYIGFTKMPKEFFKFIMDYMKEDSTYSLINYEISRFGDHKPCLYIGTHSRPDFREDMFKKILDGIKEYTRNKDNLDLSNIDETFDETVEYIFSKDGFGKSRKIIANGLAQAYENTPEYMANREGKVIYAYSPVRRFCRSSKKSLSAIRSVPGKIKGQLISKEATKEDNERE